MSNLAVISRDWDQPIRETRSSLENPQTPLSYPAEWLLDIFNGGRTDSGIRVSELTAFQTSAFLTCVDLIAGKLASLPAHVYEKQIVLNRPAHRVAYDHDYYDLVHTEPNPEMTWQTYLKTFMIHCLAWSNGFSEIQRDGGNQAVTLWPRNPSKTLPRRLTAGVRLNPAPWRPFPVSLAAGTLVFETTDGLDDYDFAAGEKSSSPRIIPAEDMLHVPGISFDGRIGQSVVWLSRQILGLQLAMEKFGAKYFANFARPGGLLNTPFMKKEDRDQARQSWMEAQGGENSNRVAVMPPGITFQAISNNPQEGQTLESRVHGRTEIAALFHVPVRMAGDTSKAGKASTEQENQEFLDYALSPWMNAIRQEFKRKLFVHPGVGRRPKNPFYLDFDTSELVRPDAASREKFYASGKQWGYLCTNDVRAMEKLNPIEEDWAEKYWMPVNMTLVDTPIDPTHQDGTGNGVTPDERAVGFAYSRIFNDAFVRFVAGSGRDLAAVRECFGSLLFAMRDVWSTQAARDLRVEVTDLTESDAFIQAYLMEMCDRANGWTFDTLPAVAMKEISQAARAMHVAAYREAAAQKAKEPLPAVA